MAQSISFDKNGLSLVHLGTDIRNINACELAQHPESNLFRVWFDDLFRYYVIESSSILLSNKHMLQYIIVAADSDNKIMGIFLFIQDFTFKILEELKEVYGEPALVSDSSICGMATNSKAYWKLASGPTVLYTKYEGSNLVKVAIDKSDIEKPTPGVTIIQ